MKQIDQQKNTKSNTTKKSRAIGKLRSRNIINNITNYIIKYRNIFTNKHITYTVRESNRKPTKIKIPTHYRETKHLEL